MLLPLKVERPHRLSQSDIIKPDRGGNGSTHDWFLGRPQVPRPKPGVDAGTDNNVGIQGVPIDIGYSAVMCMEHVLYSRLSSKAKIPDEASVRDLRQGLHGRNVKRLQFLA